jgi:deoxyribose-phosphate aldolase
MANPHFKVPELGTGQLARYIDHTLLAPAATFEQVDQHCDEAKEYNFKVSGIHSQAIATYLSLPLSSILLNTVLCAYAQGF